MWPWRVPMACASCMHAATGRPAGDRRGTDVDEQLGARRMFVQLLFDASASADACWHLEIRWTMCRGDKVEELNTAASSHLAALAADPQAFLAPWDVLVKPVEKRLACLTIESGGEIHQRSVAKLQRLALVWLGI